MSAYIRLVVEARGATTSDYNVLQARLRELAGLPDSLLVEPLAGLPDSLLAGSIRCRWHMGFPASLRVVACWSPAMSRIPPKDHGLIACWSYCLLRRGGAASKPPTASGRTWRDERCERLEIRSCNTFDYKHLPPVAVAGAVPAAHAQQPMNGDL